MLRPVGAALVYGETILYVTVPERKAREIERLRSAASEAMAALAAFASAEGGRFAVFGSFARNEVRPDSDFDVMVEFPASSERMARDFAEQVCRQVGLKPDVHLASEASDALMTRIRRDAIELS